MKRAAPTVLFFSLVAAMASQPASADTLFTTLGPPGDSYSLAGWFVSGGMYGDAVEGNSFTLSSAATVSDAILGLGNVFVPSTPVDVYIESDSAGSPGIVLASLTQVGTIPSIVAGGGLISFTCSGAACDLAAGNYWLVAVETDYSTGQDWFDTYNAATTNLAQGTSGSPTGLTVIPNYAEEAFRIDGSPSSVTPEPSSFLLLGSGLAGLAGLLKRKLAA